MNEPAVLVVDDDRLFCESLVDYFEGQGVATTYVTSYRDAVSQPLERFAVVVVDNHLPDGKGLALVESVTRRVPGPSFIMVTGDPSYDHAVAAMRHRVVDYLSKPVELEALGHAVRRVLPRVEVDGGAERTAANDPVLSEPAASYARSEVPILISGETGTGKSQLARRIHAASRRARESFVSINCATLAESIVEAELFGSCRGAYTGASERAGLVVLGDGGTLFLDEIGELSLTVQAKLLSVIEERRVRPVGGSRWRGVDVRIVAATHVDLDAAVAAGRFRADLLYRLDVGHVSLPPLRAQPERLGEAVAALLAELRAPSEAQLGPGELDRLARHRWPGNYRELRNALSRALILHPPENLCPSRCLRVPRPAGRDEQVARRDEPVAGRGEPVARRGEPMAGRTLADLERQHILATLESQQGHRGRTARVLGISEATLRRKLRAWSMDLDQNGRLTRSS